jgi:hypothetical protein
MVGPPQIISGLHGGSPAASHWEGDVAASPILVGPRRARDLRSSTTHLPVVRHHGIVLHLRH